MSKQKFRESSHHLATNLTIVLVGFVWGNFSIPAQETVMGQTSLTVWGTTEPSSPDERIDAENSGPEDLVRMLLLNHLPRTYENSKKWGLTKPRWNGIDLSLDGWNIKSKRKWKDVNHGTWTRYQAWLIDPEKELTIHFRDLRPSGTSRVAFELIVEAMVGANGRLAEWNRGLQLYSLSAEADARIRLQMTCDVGWKLDVSHFPPDLLLDPQVNNAKLDLIEFHLHRLSDIDGSVARNLGDSLRDDLEREMNERHGKIVEKLNRAIDKNRDKLRLSPHDWVSSGWSKLVRSDNSPGTLTRISHDQLKPESQAKE